MENLLHTVGKSCIGLVGATLRVERFTQVHHEYRSENARQSQRCFWSLFSLVERCVLGCGGHGLAPDVCLSYDYKIEQTGMYFQLSGLIEDIITVNTIW